MNLGSRFFIVLILAQFSLYAQQTQQVNIQFEARYGTQILSKDSVYIASKYQDTLQVETLKFYISSLQFLQNEKIVFEEKQRYHLIDLLSNETSNINLTIPTKCSYNKIQFQLGIDSATNTSGALGGDLDPTKGMYWTWQNGYINLKLEGTSTKSTARKNEFEFHLGGYASPFATCQQIVFDCKPSQTIAVNVDIEKILNDIDLSHLNHIMSPGEKAVKLAEKAKTMFSLQ